MAEGPVQAGAYQMLPDMPPEQYDALKADIDKRGMLTPIDVDEHGNILDGHHRHRACLELAITDFPSVVRPGLSEADKRLFARKANALRRHLTRAQLREIIAAQLKETPDWANNRIAGELGADGKTVATVREALEATSGNSQVGPPHRRRWQERPVKRPRIPCNASNLDELERILKGLDSLNTTSISDLEGFSQKVNSALQSRSFTIQITTHSLDVQMLKLPNGKVCRILIWQSGRARWCLQAYRMDFADRFSRTSPNGSAMKVESIDLASIGATRRQHFERRGPLIT